MDYGHIVLKFNLKYCVSSLSPDKSCVLLKHLIILITLMWKLQMKTDYKSGSNNYLHIKSAVCKIQLHVRFFFFFCR